jgi:hypothetical protein
MTRIARFEHLGAHHEDALLMFVNTHGTDADHAANAIRRLPWWARHWDNAAQVWRIHPGLVATLADRLARLGFHIEMSKR